MSKLARKRRTRQHVIADLGIAELLLEDGGFQSLCRWAEHHGSDPARQYSGPE